MSRVHAPVVVQESLSQNQKSRLALILCVLDFPDEDSVRVAGVPLKMRKYNWQDFRIKIQMRQISTVSAQIHTSYSCLISVPSGFMQKVLHCPFIWIHTSVGWVLPWSILYSPTKRPS